MRRFHGRGLALAFLGTLGCIGIRFHPPPLPSVPLSAPSPPNPPAPIETQRSARDEQQVTSVRAPDDLRGRTIAIALRGPEALQERAWPMLARRLLEARFTRILPPPIASLRGSVQSERGTARTTVEGELRSLFHLRADTPAEVLLVVELSASAEAQESQVAFPSGSLEAYESEYARFRTTLTETRQRLQAEVATWSAGFQDAEAQYAQRGGQWRNEQDVSAREQGRAFLGRVQAYETQLESAQRAAVPPAELVRRAAAQRAASRVSSSFVRLRATLTDLSPGQTSWMIDLARERPDEATALSEVLNRLVAELPTGSTASAGASLPVP